jgi:hypothetical protein
MGKPLFSLGPNISVEVYWTTSFYLYRSAQTASPFGLSAHRTRRPASHLPLSFYHRNVGPSCQPSSLLFLFLLPR